MPLTHHSTQSRLTLGRLIVLFPISLGLLPTACGGLPRASSRPIQETDTPVRSSPVLGEINVDPMTQTLLELHNERRAVEMLPALTLEPRLNEAAKGHVLGMIERGVMGHEGEGGSTPADRVRERDYPYINVGENVAAGQETALDVMESWMESPGHRENILGDFEQMGGALGKDTEGKPYWCVVFASPLPQLDQETASLGLLQRLNTYREEKNLAPLSTTESLSKLADQHAQQMAKSQSLSPPGESIQASVSKAGIGYRRLAYSVASGHPGAQEVLDALTSNPGQRRNLVGEFDVVGIGYANDEEGQPYWCVILVQQPAS